MKTISLRNLFLNVTVGAALLVPAVLALPAHAGPLLPTVGPDSNDAKVTCGYLKVYSRTEQTQWGENTYYNVHTAYWISNADGKRIKTVANHDSSIDETPEKVSLAPGRYVVRAWSDDQGLVTVPVIVKLAQTTSVRLESGSAETGSLTAGNITKN
jgi:hypothetical protein